MREFNQGRTRLVTDEAGALFAAFVGYEGGIEDEEWVGRHAGCFHSLEHARAWLRGETGPDFRVPALERK